MVGKQVVWCLAKGEVEQTVTVVFSAGTKFTFDNMGKSVGFSLISSGRHEEPETIFEDLFRHFVEPAFGIRPCRRRETKFSKFLM